MRAQRASRLRESRRPLHTGARDAGGCALGVSTPASAALSAARAALAGVGAALDAIEAALGERGDELVAIRDGWQGVPGEALVRWARSGRLVAFEVERGRLVAWSSDLRRAVEARPARQLRAVEIGDADPLEAALASGTLRTGGGEPHA